MTTPLQQAQADADAVVAYLKTLNPPVSTPPITTPPPVTTPPVSTPPVVTAPANFTLPTPAPGFKRVLYELWNTNVLNSVWGTPYSGRSEGAQPGFFVAAHSVVKGDGWLRLQAFQDPAGVAKAWTYDATIAAKINEWGGAGVACGIPVGLTFNLAYVLKWDTMPGMTPIVLMFGNTWPPEMDLSEMNAALKGGPPVANYQQVFHYAAPDQREFATLTIAAGVDLSQEHLWLVSCTPTGCSTRVLGAQGNVVATATATFTSAMIDPTNKNSLGNPMTLRLQHQTGDPNNPAVDAGVTAANPITMYVGPVSIDVPL